MINKKLSEILSNSYNFTREQNSSIITVEHIFAFLLLDEKVQSILVKLGVDVPKMIEDMFIYLKKFDEPKNKERNPMESAVLSQIIERALKNIVIDGRLELMPEDLLVEFADLEECYATYLLKKEKIRRSDLVDLLNEGYNEAGLNNNQDIFNSIGDLIKNTKIQKHPPINNKKPKPEDKNFLIDVSAEVEEKGFEPIIGRDTELLRMIEILSRKKKSNPILVGEAGVGKTSLIYGLVEKIRLGDVPENLLDAQVLQLNITSLTAGTKFRGDFEQKIESMLKELKSYDNPILFIDEIHNMLGAGSVSNSTVDLGEMLKSSLSDGSLKVIGTTTYSDYKSSFQKDNAMARRFSKVDIKEPSVEDSILILEGIKSIYEKHHNVSYSTEIIGEIVSLALKHLHDRFLPDSAIDLMDEVGAKKKVLMGKKTKITHKDIEDTIAELANIPSKNVDTDNKKQLKNLSANLKKSIFGQDEIIDLVTETIFISKAGLSTPNKPISSFLFTGPTGVGKTELVKELAKNLGIKYNKLDMSEYMEKHSVSKLIGAAPGYVGYEEGGVLVEMIKKNPHSIILFDEIEKADPSISNILLQILDEGSLTDNTGYRADFKNAIVVLTSNLGTKEVNKISFGGEEGEISKKTDSAIKNYFAPEIRNRLDNIVEFNHLTRENILKIVDKNIDVLQTQLNTNKVEIKFSKQAKEFIGDKGYDQSFGARPIEREFNKLVKPKITKEILFGSLVKGGKIEVSVKDDELFFVFKEKE